MGGTASKMNSPLGVTVVLADMERRARGAGLLLSWGGGRSLQIALCSTWEILQPDGPLLMGRCGLEGREDGFRALADLTIGTPIRVGDSLGVVHLDKHEIGGVGWPLRHCAEGPNWRVEAIAEGTAVFAPALMPAQPGDATTEAVLVERCVAGWRDGETGKRLLISAVTRPTLGGTPVFTRRPGSGSLQLTGLLDGSEVSELGLCAVVPVEELLASSQAWKNARAQALPSLEWAGQSPGEYKIHARVAEFLAANATSGRFSKATVTARRQDLLNLDRWARSRGLDLATMEDQYLALYFEERAAQGRRATTLIRERGTIERFFEYLVSRGARAEGSDCPEVSDDEHYRPKTILSVREVQRVLDFEDLGSTTAARDRAIVELMYGTALRAKELATLRMSQLDLRKGLLRLPARRQGTRELILNEPVRKALKVYLRSTGMSASLRTDELVFRNPRGRALTRQTIGKILVRRAAVAGIKKKVTGMTLRDSAASHLLARGFDRKGVAQFLGLALASDVQRYLSPRARQSASHAR
jgi:integrase/recombinase XerD